MTEILAGWRRGQVNIPAAVSLSVITLMVLAFDVGMLYAASMLRLLATRRAGLGERWVHVAVMVSVAAIEALTYAYMVARYERPLTPLAWALIVVRAAAAPLLAVYLSMARPLPVTARDILAQIELASGAGVLRDVVSIANDTSAPLAAKVSIYGASAVMAPAERTRLDTLLEVVQRQQGTQPPCSLRRRWRPRQQNYRCHRQRSRPRSWSCQQAHSLVPCHRAMRRPTSAHRLAPAHPL